MARLIVGLREYSSDISAMAEDILNITDELSAWCIPSILEGIIYMAIFDNEFNHDSFWEVLIDFLTSSYIAHIEDDVEYECKEKQVTDFNLSRYQRDVFEKETDVIIFVDKILDGVGKFYTRDDVECRAEEMARITAELFAEYRLLSNDTFNIISESIKDLIEISLKRNIDTVNSIQLNRRRWVAFIEMDDYV